VIGESVLVGLSRFFKVYIRPRVPESSTRRAWMLLLSEPYFRRSNVHFVHLSIEVNID
jgi:hypothetical protein